jgi:lactate permease
VSLLPVLRAASPYLALVALILVTRLVEPLRTGLDGIRWSWHLWSTFTGSVSPLYHPGTLLMAPFLIGAVFQRVPLRTLGMAAGAAFRQPGMVAVALVSMLMRSRLLVRAGMVDVLAASAASALGGAWPLFAPLAGVLGTFVTGSATASNILFTDSQQATAETLGIPVLTMTAAQGFGAAVGNIICPHNIIAGGSTVGLDGMEGAVLRCTLVPCLVYASLGDLLAIPIVAQN